jgi:hypothetical protein
MNLQVNFCSLLMLRNFKRHMCSFAVTPKTRTVYEPKIIIYCKGIKYNVAEILFFCKTQGIGENYTREKRTEILFYLRVLASKQF